MKNIFEQMAAVRECNFRTGRLDILVLLFLCIDFKILIAK